MKTKRGAAAEEARKAEQELKELLQEDFELSEDGFDPRDLGEGSQMDGLCDLMDPPHEPANHSSIPPEINKPVETQPKVEAEV